MAATHGAAHRNDFTTQLKRLVGKLLLLTTLAVTHTAYADEFWAHQVATQVDVAYGKHADQVMDVYNFGDRVGEPTYFEMDTSPRPTLVWIHGGGWIAGDKSNQVSQLIPYLARGWTVYNINYRQGSGTAPLAVNDAMCAYDFIIKQLTKRGQPTNQVVVSGASAGGHLALTVGLLNTVGDHPCRSEQAPRAIVNWFGITDIGAVDKYLNNARPQGNYARAWAKTPKRIAEISTTFSPIRLVTDKTPPIITIHGTADTVVPYEQATNLHRVLSTPNELVTLMDGNHSGFTDAQYKHAFGKIFGFLKEH